MIEFPKSIRVAETLDGRVATVSLAPDGVMFFPKAQLLIPGRHFYSGARGYPSGGWFEENSDFGLLMEASRNFDGGVFIQADKVPGRSEVRELLGGAYLGYTLTFRLDNQVPGTLKSMLTGGLLGHYFKIDPSSARPNTGEMKGYWPVVYSIQPVKRFRFV